ncbi:C2 domain-containing protein [Phycomyces nitens]|nr:C2 domain-containing protein [Phycomyces nitens]
MSAPINADVTDTFDDSVAPIHTVESSTSAPKKLIPADIVPDLHAFAKSDGLQTELATHDAREIKKVVTEAEKKPVIPSRVRKKLQISTGDTPNDQEETESPTMVGTFPNCPVPASRIPSWYKTGWTAFSTESNPGGSLNIKATQPKFHVLDQVIPNMYYGEWWHNASALVVTGLMAWTIGKVGGGLGPVFLGCLFLGTYYQLSIRRFRRNARDDIQRQVAKVKIESDEETIEWVNSFVQKFWLIFEPVLSALVVENLDTYITDYLPSFLDSVRLTTFTLGTKPFLVDSVKTYPNTEPDTVCMDWRVSFMPNDLTDLSAKELDSRVNPRIVMTARVGKGSLGAGFPILVEDMSFTGHMRVTIRFMSKFPYIKTIDACFLEKPEFDYVCKPLGGDSFGFDVNIIPGLQGFIADQIHAILGPLLYAPNVFTVEVDKFMAGDLDMSQANGVLAITVYSASSISHCEDLIYGPSNPFIRFYVDHAQELGRTSIKDNTLEPQWNETHFLLLNNLNCQLCLELRDHNPGSKDRRLATGIFNLRDLDSETKYDQEGLNVVLLRDGKSISDLRVDLHYLPISKPIKNIDGTIEPAVESNSGVLRLTVHECSDLQGDQISPYVRVIISGTEKLKTPVVKRNNNPSYEVSQEMVILDKSEVYIRVEVKNSSKGKELLGVCTSYLNDLMRTQEENGYRLNLTRDGKNVGTVRMSAQWKPVIMSGISEGLGGHGFENPPVGVVRLTLWEARDLRNVEAVTNGKSDPYVRVLSGNQIRATTEVVDNNLYPEWGEIHYIPIHSPKEDLLLEVMDWNQRTKDKSLGVTEVHMSTLVRQCIGDQAENPDRWCESTGKKIDQWAQLRSTDRRSTKGELRYTAEFLPVLSIPQSPTPEDEDTQGNEEPPLKDLHGSYTRYTPDNLVDLISYRSGIIKVKIHEVSLPQVAVAYCRLVVDSLSPQYKTSKMRGKDLKFEEIGDAFIKETDFSRVAVEIKPASSDEKDDDKIGYWVDSAGKIIRRIQQQRRRQKQGFEVTSKGDWYPLMGTDAPGRIRLSFDYIPLSNFVLNPDESLENQGNLTVTLVSATNLMAADKSGTSDPYVVFTVNGERVHRSAVIKKTLNPVWKNEVFTVAIQSRVTASLRIEVFDWNQIKGHDPIGSGGITIRGDMVESFESRDAFIPLDGVAGVSGSVRVRFMWQPKLLINKKTQTSVLGDNRMYTSELPESVPELPSNTARQSSIFDVSGESGISSSNRSDNESVRTNPRFSIDTSSIISSSMDASGGSESEGVNGLAIVQIIEARGLRGVDKGGTSDPFVRVVVGKSPVYKTKVIKKTLAPEWHEMFSVPVSNQPTVFDFKVKDHNKLKHSIDLGQCRWNIWDLLHVEDGLFAPVDIWLPLYPTGSGELHLKIELAPT